MVEAEHSTQALATLNRVMKWRGGGGLQESILETLMIPLGVVVRHELMDCMSKRSLPERAAEAVK